MPTAPSPEPVEHALLPGLVWALKPMDAEVECIARANTARTMARLADGPQALAELGFEPGDYTRLTEAELMLGLSSFVSACWFAVLLLEDWNVVDQDDQPVETSPANINLLLRHTPGLLDAFMKVVDAPARARRDEGNGSAPPRNGSGAAAARTAGDAEPTSAAPAQPALSS